MSFYSELTKFVKRLFKAETAQLRTNTVCQVVSYDADTNLAVLQPCIMGIRTDDTESPNKQLPQVADIPVFQYGSGLVFSTVAPAVGSYGLYAVSDRGLDNWILQGGVVPPSGSQRFDISNGVFFPGFVPTIDDGNNGKLPVAVSTDRISFRTRTGDTEISVLADETININNASASVVIDTSGNVIVAASEVQINGSADFAVAYDDLKSAFDTLKGDLNNLITAYNAHIHITTATIGIGPPGVIAPTTSVGTPSAADMASAKVDTVKLP